MSNFDKGGGLSVTGKIENSALNFLVDTGSAITILSGSSFDKMNIANSKLEAVAFEVHCADGQGLFVKGQLDLELTLGPINVLHKIVVADIKQEAILGMDFMATQGCKLDLKKSIMSINGIDIVMWNNGSSHSTVSRVVLFQSDIVPARHKKLVEAKVIRRGSEAQFNLVEPSRRSVERTDVLLGRSLADNSSSNIVVGSCNPSDNVELYPNTIVGCLEPITDCLLGLSPSGNSLTTEEISSDVSLPQNESGENNCGSAASIHAEVSHVGSRGSSPESASVLAEIQSVPIFDGSPENGIDLANAMISCDDTEPNITENSAECGAISDSICNDMPGVIHSRYTKAPRLHKCAANQIDGSILCRVINFTERPERKPPW